VHSLVDKLKWFLICILITTLNSHFNCDTNDYCLTYVFTTTSWILCHLYCSNWYYHFNYLYYNYCSFVFIPLIIQSILTVLYTASCQHSLVLLRMGEIIAQNMLSWLKLLIKLLLLHLVGCLYYCINDAQLHKHQMTITVAKHGHETWLNHKEFNFCLQVSSNILWSLCNKQNY